MVPGQKRQHGCARITPELGHTRTFLIILTVIQFLSSGLEREK